MNLYVLDTDHLTLYVRGDSEVSRRVDALPAEEVALTIITVEEQLSGWYAQVRKAKKPEQEARAYQGLLGVTEIIREFQILPHTLTTIERYLELRKQFPRAGRNDLCIAAIALEHDATLVTRNRADFEFVPGLPVEDWSRP